MPVCLPADNFISASRFGGGDRLLTCARRASRWQKLQPGLRAKSYFPLVGSNLKPRPQSRGHLDISGKPLREVS